MDRFCACAVTATATASNATMRASSFIESSYGLDRILPHAWFGVVPGMTHAQQAQRLGAALLRRILHRRVEAPAMAVHGYEQRPEGPDAEFPQRFGVEVVEVDVLDGLDPGRLERRGAADDGEVHPAQVAERLERAFSQAALADDDAHAVL